MKKTEKKPLVQSVERALDILEIVGEADSSLRVIDIAKHIGLHQNTTNNLIRTLFRRGFLRQNEDGKYQIGPKCHSLADRSDRWAILRETSIAPMKKISTETGFTCFLAVYDSGGLKCVNYVEGTGIIRISPPRAWHNKIHCTATGKVLLAFDENIFASTITGKVLEKFTDKTICSQKNMTKECKMINRHGYALSKDESTIGVSALGVPVFGKNKKIRAALGVSFPTFYLGNKTVEIKKLVRKLIISAKTIEKSLQ